MDRDDDPRLLDTVTEHACAPPPGKFALADTDESYVPRDRVNVNDPMRNTAVPPLP